MGHSLPILGFLCQCNFLKIPILIFAGLFDSCTLLLSHQNQTYCQNMTPKVQPQVKIGTLSFKSQKPDGNMETKNMAAFSPDFS